MFDFVGQIVAAIGITLGSFNPHHVEPQECGERDGIEYCYYEGDSSTQDVLYFFHGFGDDVRGWSVNPVAKNIRDHWYKNGVRRPHVVTLSQHVWWYVEPIQGLNLDRFLNWFESTHFASVSSRSLYGDSMGGHNAYRWALDSPQTFSKLALICPAFPKYFIMDLDPGPPTATWEFFSDQLIASYYRESSQPDFNPVVHTLNEQGPNSISRVHIVASEIDDFGFNTGDLALYRTLKKDPQVETTLEVQRVGHCVPEATQLAEFLAP